MPFLRPGEKCAGDMTRKRIGLPNGFGWIMPAWSEFGDSNAYSGVYQRRPRRKKYIQLGDTIPGRRERFFMKPAWPKNTITEARTVVRTKFADGVAAWHALTISEKRVYNERAAKMRLSGFCLHQREFLKS